VALGEFDIRRPNSSAGDRNKMEPETEAQQASYFQDAVVEWSGRTFHLSAADGRALEGIGCYWHGPAAPSVYLAAAVYQEARRQIGEAEDNIALELAAQALGITVEQLKGKIELWEQGIRSHEWIYE
jgi:hypothetical protein